MSTDRPRGLLLRLALLALLVAAAAGCSIFKTILTVENQSGGTITSVYVYSQGGSPGTDFLAGATIANLHSWTLRSELFAAGSYTIRILMQGAPADPWDYPVVFDGSKYTLTVTTHP
jgi:hypothetical protein